MVNPGWLPAMVLMVDYDNVWSRYVDAVYAVFYTDFLHTQPKFRGYWVKCRRDPLDQGKEAGFWHCISGGIEESARTPEFRRMERIGWVRAILENADDPCVQTWLTTRGSDRRTCVWFREEFLIVLAERCRKRDGVRYWQLITAYDTPDNHRKQKLMRERDENSPLNG